MSVKNAALSCHRRSGYLSIAKKKKHLSSKSRQPKLGGQVCQGRKWQAVFNILLKTLFGFRQIHITTLASKERKCCTDFRYSSFRITKHVKISEIFSLPEQPEIAYGQVQSTKAVIWYGNSFLISQMLNSRCRAHLLSPNFSPYSGWHRCCQATDLTDSAVPSPVI